MLVIMLASTVVPCIAAEAATASAQSTVDRVYSSDDADKMATNDALLAEFMPKYESLRDKITNKESGYSLGTATSNIGTPDASWTAEVPELRTDHPHLSKNLPKGEELFIIILCV